MRRGEEERQRGGRDAEARRRGGRQRLARRRRGEEARRRGGQVEASDAMRPEEAMQASGRPNRGEARRGEAKRGRGASEAEMMPLLMGGLIGATIRHCEMRNARRMQGCAPHACGDGARRRCGCEAERGVMSRGGARHPHQRPTGPGRADHGRPGKPPKAQATPHGHGPLSLSRSLSVRCRTHLPANLRGTRISACEMAG